MNTKKIILILVVLIAVVAILAVTAKNKKMTNIPNSMTSASALLSATALHSDFGRVSMSAGNVQRVFKIENKNNSPVTVSRMYTSCMCTEAILKYGEKSYGPIGMPGHGALPAINQEIAPGATADVIVIFDPTAHGPAGLGKIERQIYIEEDGGGKLILGISGFVMP